MSVDRILLTNDDGIDAVGLRAMRDALSADYDVVAVAPTADQSSTGRTLSEGVSVSDHELGYAVDGTPVDCVVAGLGELVPDADLVVAGCNEGANLGAYTLGRSGTVSAAVEAAFFDVPAVATSMYVPGDEDWWKRELEPTEFANATRATAFLVDQVTSVQFRQQLRHAVILADQGASRDFGRMGREHQFHGHVGEAASNGVGCKTGFHEAVHDPRGAFLTPRFLAIALVAAAQTHPVVLLGDIGHVEKLVERPRHIQQLVLVQIDQFLLQISHGHPAVFARIPGFPAYVFHNTEKTLAFLPMQCMAQQLTQQAHIVAQGFVGIFGYSSRGVHHQASGYQCRERHCRVHLVALQLLFSN